MLSDSKSFIKSYINYVQESTEMRFDKFADNQTVSGEGMHRMCNFNGKLVERVSSERETYLECSCLPSVHGVTCAINPQLYHDVQTFVAGMLADCKSVVRSMSQQYLYEIL